LIGKKHFAKVMGQLWLTTKRIL